MVDNSFFEEQKEQSMVKSTIVAKYFDVWAKIIISTQKKHPKKSQEIAYIDLFAGPGRYNDGTQSTPLMILTNAIKTPDLRERLIAIFNDKDENNSKTLEKTINEIPGIEKLKHKPEVHSFEVDEDIVKIFEGMNFIPALFFIDPWGYKGLSLQLMNAVLKDWGCDAIFFFNYNRINMGINNETVIHHMDLLFGKKKPEKLREQLKNKNSEGRESLIVEELCQSLKSYCYRYVLPFRFKNNRGSRTSHYLIFVSKHFLGYDIMKDIMASESTSNEQGVPSFEYNPADFLPKQMQLFRPASPLDDLKEDLLNTFKEQTLTMKEIYEQHNVDTPYIKRNYKDVLRRLYDNGIIKAETTKGKPPRKGTFPDDTSVTFP